MAFHCVSCNGSMAFDPASQQMVCEHCGATCAPGDFVVGKADTGVPDVAMARFSCQSCGAELEATDDSMIGLCPFCGGQSLVRDAGGGLSVEGILPFRVGREDCQRLYSEFTEGIHYLPDDFGDARHLENFTGIYVPFYQYDVEFGDASIEGIQTVGMSGGYDEIRYYHIVGRADGPCLNGPTFDGSSYLDDELAARIMPYDMSKLCRYNPAYLAGFYADTPTVGLGHYVADAQAHAQRVAIHEIAAHLKKRKRPIVVAENASSIDAKVVGRHRVLLPMWFLTWRKGDRVAYAVINGQSGKVSSDLPVDMRTFWKVGAVIATTIFILLELLVQPTPLVTSLMSLVAALCMAGGIRREGEAEYVRQTHLNDKGWWGSGDEDAEVLRESGLQVERSAEKNRKFWFRLRVVGLFLLAVSVTVLFTDFISDPRGGFSAFVSSLGWCAVVLQWVLPPVVGGYAISVVRRIEGWHREVPSMRDALTSSVVLLVSVIINAGITYASPVNDEWYYLGDALCVAGLVYASVGMMRIYNQSTTRPLPRLFGREEV